MRLTRRIGAYGLCRDEAGRWLLTRGSVRAAFPGVWQIPGGGVEHGEHPATAVVREFAEETGLAVEVTGLRSVVADVLRLPGGDVLEHCDRIIYDVAVRGGDLRDEPHGTTDRVAWMDPAALVGLPLLPVTAELLGRPVDPDVLAPKDTARQPKDAGPAPAGPAGPAPAEDGPTSADQPAPDARPARGRRFGAYGLVTDPAGRVLLSLIADGYPGAGRWHLPGGGTDHGEQPGTAVLREVAEESGQLGRVTALLDVSDHHDPSARGPEGYPIDWHVVRVLFRVRVDVPTPAVVTEAAGGSTARAGWFRPDKARTLRLTGFAASALRRLAEESAGN